MTLNKSNNFNENYAARIARVDAIEPIPDAHSIVYAVLDTNKVVVSKDTKVGDIVIYFPVGSSICNKYLSHHNLYEKSEALRNSNYDDLCRLQADINLLQVKNPKTEEDIVKLEELNARLKRMTGFFNKNGLVRMLKLRGVPSEGYVASVSTLEDVWPELKNMIWTRYLNQPFDSIGSEVLCEKWIPREAPKEQPASHPKGKFWKKSQKKLKRFDRLVPGEFEFHYDTKMLKDNMHQLDPDTEVTVSVKCHGTSGIFGNLLTNRQLTPWEKIKKFFGATINNKVFDSIYSSRRVIKNQYINPGKGQDFYSVDVWGKVNDLLKDLIDPGMTVYGEIVGYEEGLSKCIQSPKGIDHDYGCAKGTWAFMPYRITTKEGNDLKEWNVQKVLAWTQEMRSKLQENDKKKLLDINILYHGTMKDMYPGLYEEVKKTHNKASFKKAVSDYKHSETYNGYLPAYLESYEEYLKHLWRIEVLEKMKNDKDMLGMELPEPMCNNKKAPREGIVLRIDDDKEPRAWKLKTSKHQELSQKAADSGEADPEDLA